MTSRPNSALGWFLGLIDYCFLLTNLLKRKSRFKYFPLGWGNLSAAYDLQDKQIQNLKAKQEGSEDKIFKLDDTHIEWGEKKEERSITLQQGKFESPISKDLPEESKTACFHLVTPKGNKETTNKQSNSSVYVILLPATGEMGKSTRLKIARNLADKYGWSSIIMTAPFYGVRKPKGQTQFFITTVSNLLIQSQGVIEETAALGSYLLNKDPGNQVCVSGFSWGAAMTGCSCAAMLASGIDGQRLACAPYVGCASPVILADSVLKGGVNWDALAEKDDGGEKGNIQLRLQNELNKTQLSLLSNTFKESDKPVALGGIKVVATTHDGIIQPKYALDFLDQLVALRGGPSTGEKLPVQWIHGGHIVGALVREKHQTQAIVDAINMMKKIHRCRL